jgi:hypothetical protein
MLSPVYVDKADGLWMLLHGHRRKFASKQIFEELIGSSPPLCEEHEVEHYGLGPEICEGSCLVRGDGSLGIFLVTGYPSTFRYKIESFEAFSQYGFQLSAVRNIPIIVLEQIPLGSSITTFSA